MNIFPQIIWPTIDAMHAHDGRLRLGHPSGLDQEPRRLAEKGQNGDARTGERGGHALQPTPVACGPGHQGEQHKVGGPVVGVNEFDVKNWTISRISTMSRPNRMEPNDSIAGIGQG